MKIENNRQGFSILEILVSLAIGMIILVALGVTFVSQRKAYIVQEQVTEMVQTARAGIDIMGREIQMAGFDRLETMQRTDPDATDGDFVGIKPTSAIQIDIFADLNGDGRTTPASVDDDQTNEHITYAFVADTHQITRNTNAPGGAAQPFIENVESFSVTYLDEDGNETSNTEKIHEIVVSLTVRTSKADRDFADNEGYRTQTLTANFIPRNLNTTSTTASAGSEEPVEGCRLDIYAVDVCRGSGSAKYIYLKVYVIDQDNGEPVTEATVTWTVASEGAVELEDLGGGYYGGDFDGCTVIDGIRSANTYNHSQTISISATKTDCAPDAVATTSG